jgi:hypothetical protein
MQPQPKYDLADAIRLSLDDGNFDIYCEQFLKIQSQDYGLIPLRLNSTQRLLVDAYQRQKARGEGVRIMVLKARRLGSSTATEALCYRDTTSHEDFNSVITAHLAEASGNLYDMFRIYYEYCPAGFRPHRKSTGNQFGLDFDTLRSSIRVQTAESPEASRSGTSHFLHISELAFWTDPDKAMTALLQTLTRRGTAIVESTANGYGNYFYEMWRDAVRGQNGWEPLFLAWWNHQEYRISLDPGEVVRPDKDEQTYADRYKLDGEQVKWMRWCRKTNCNNDWDKFRQEYPANPEEAFIASGRPVFDVPALMARDAEIVDIKPRRVQVQMVGELLNMTDSERGLVEIYTEPVKGWMRRYVIGADSMEGRSVERTLTARKKASGDADCNVAYVLDRVTGEQVAYARSQQIQNEWADVLFALAVYYAAGNPIRTGWPMLVPEVNNSIGVLLRLKELYVQYRVPMTRIIHRAGTLDAEMDVPTDKLGFRTDPKTKKLILGVIQQMITDGTDSIKSRRVVSECMTMVYDGEGRMAAQSGYWDDSVMAMALAHHGDQFDQAPAEVSRVDAAKLRHKRVFGKSREQSNRVHGGYWSGS